MLKFLRKYAKMVLPLFTAFLALAFLVSNYQGKNNGVDAKAVIGHLENGKKLTMQDRLNARTQLAVLESLIRDPSLLAGESVEAGTEREEAKVNRWMLIQAEASKLGIDVSESEVSTAVFYVDERPRKEGENRTYESTLTAVCAKANGNETALRDALRSYLRAEALRQLMSGTANEIRVPNAQLTTPGLQRLALLPSLRQEVSKIQQEAYQNMFANQGNAQAQQNAQRAYLRGEHLMSAVNGTQRLSTPLLAHQLQNLSAVVSGRLVVIPAVSPTRIAAQPEPTPEQLQKIFEPLKESPRGSAPNGFGYRLPARFKIEALVVPIEQARLAVKDSISEDQVRDWFDAHPEHFTAKDSKDEKEVAPTLTAENRLKARGELLENTARNKVLEFAHTGDLALAGDLRAAAANNNQLPGSPTPLQAAADAIQQKFGFMPQLLTPTDIVSASVEAMKKESKVAAPLITPGRTEAWMTPIELLYHPVLGQAKLEEQSRVLIAYIANHLAGGPEDQPLPSSLQVGVNLRLPIARAQNGDCIIARVVAADAPRAAATVDEVKDQLIIDARTLAAYQELCDHQNQLCANVAVNGMDKFATETDHLFNAPVVTRVDTNGSNAAPFIPGVGSSDILIKAIFERAEKLRQTPEGVKNSTAINRLVPIPLDSACAVVIFELQDYAPIAKSRVDELSKNILARFNANTAASADAKTEDPLTEAALKKRLGFVVK